MKDPSQTTTYFRDPPNPTSAPCLGDKVLPGPFAGKQILWVLRLRRQLQGLLCGSAQLSEHPTTDKDRPEWEDLPLLYLIAHPRSRESPLLGSEVTPQAFESRRLQEAPASKPNAYLGGRGLTTGSC